MDVLARERLRDVELQTQLDSPTIYPFIRSIHIPRIKDIPGLRRFHRQEDLARTTGFARTPGPQLADAQTTVYLGHTDAALWVGFVCSEPRPEEIRALFHRPPIGRDDHVILSLDTSHDHRTYTVFMLNPLGVKEGKQMTVGRGNRQWEHKVQMTDAILEWRGEAEVRGKRWVAAMAIPFETLGLDGPPKRGVWGVNFERYRRPDYGESSQWSTTHRYTAAPWAFGDLYFHRPPVTLERLGMGELTGSGGTATLWVRNPGGRKVSATAVIETITDHGLRPWRSSRKRFAVPARDCVEVRVPYSFDVDGWADQRFRLRLLDKAGRVVYEGRRGFGYKNGQKLMVSFPRTKTAPPNPKPGDPEFMDKKRRYIIGRLPRFERVTTAQGAPSDFTIRSVDGDVIFNLMEAGALARIGEYLHGLFPEENDRLLGANFFVHQPAGMIYSNLETRLVHQISPLSLLRFGSAQCCCHAAVLCGILSHMRVGDSDAFYRTRRIGLEGHVITVVEVDGRYVLLDPSVGRFFYLWDDKNLATAEDIAADLTLADRAGKDLRKYFEGAARFHYYGCGVIPWPPGAPRE